MTTYVLLTLFVDQEWVVPFPPDTQVRVLGCSLTYLKTHELSVTVSDLHGSIYEY